jgi:hypothetical protein
MSLARYLSKLGALLNSDGKVPQGALATNVAGNGPAFSAYLGTTQSVSSGVWTKLQLNTEDFDTNSNYDASTYRFTPTVAGYYQVNYIAYAVGTGTTTSFTRLYKNGTPFQMSSYAPPISSVDTASAGSLVVYLNGTTDYIELYGILYASSGLTFPAMSSGVGSRFSGFLARAA